jgi:hypothetical protein
VVKYQWPAISSQPAKPLRTIVEKLREKNLENAGKTNFFLMSKAVFFGV